MSSRKKVDVTEALHRKLTRHAKRTGLSHKRIVDVAVDKYLSSQKVTRGTSGNLPGPQDSPLAPALVSSN